MKGMIIIRNGEIKKVMNIKGFIEMRLSKIFDKLSCQIIEDNLNTVIFHVKTNKKNFNEIKHELDVLYPNTCCYLEPKAES